MVILQVYTKCIKTKYKSPLISKATFISLMCGVLTIFGSFVLAYKSKGLWLKHDSFFEQPDVKFRGEYLFTAVTNNPSQPVTCSTFKKYERYAASFDGCSMLKVREEDNDLDDKSDVLHFNLLIRLPVNSSMEFFSLIIPVDYELHRPCPLQMQAVILFQHQLISSVSEMTAYGDLTIFQSTPIICHKILTHNFYNYPVIKDVHDINSYSVQNIIEEYSRRNISAHLTNVYTVMVYGKERIFNLSLHVRYPQHKIAYLPSFWQVLKFAWIQYYAVYIIVITAVQALKTYIFNNRLVLFYEDNPMKKND